MGIHGGRRSDLVAHAAFREPGLPGLAMLNKRSISGAVPAVARHHHHQVVQVQYLHRGVLTLHLGEAIHHLTGGQAIVIPPGVDHHTGGGVRRSAILYLIEFDLRHTRNLLGLGRADATHVAAALRVLPSVPLTVPGLHRLFEHAIALRADSGPLRDLRLRYSLVELIAGLHATALNVGTDFPIISDNVIKATQRRILAHLDDLPSLSILAAAVGLSPSGLRARFARAVGVPLNTWAQHARIDRAADLITAGDSVTSVAYHLGFASSQHFAQAFRRHTGMSPSAWRGRRS